MKTGIAFSHDAVYMTPFVNKLIGKYHAQLDIVILTKGSITKKNSKADQINYFLSLLIILGIPTTVKNVFRMLFKKKETLEETRKLCKTYNIPFHEVQSINGKAALELLHREKLDLLFNQSQHIVQQKVLDAVNIAVFNRHGALLPTYRGRLAPFWQKYKREPFAGVTFHIVDDQIDNGPIIVQKKWSVASSDTVNTLINRVLTESVDLFGEVLEFFKKPDYKKHLQENDASKASYFGSPRLKDAIKYRLGLNK